MTHVLRRGGAEDAPALARIFRAAILRGTKGLYSAEQRLAWANVAPDPEFWRGRVEDIELVILEVEGRAVGFAGLRGDCFDLLFVHPDHTGQGHARRLHDALAGWARLKGLTSLVTHASHVSRPVFAHFGWQFVSAGEIEKNGAMLGYSAMRLDLPPLEGAAGTGSRDEAPPRLRD